MIWVKDAAEALFGLFAFGMLCVLAVIIGLADLAAWAWRKAAGAARRRKR